MTKTTDGAARAESNLFELCRVATEEDRRSTIDALGREDSIKLISIPKYGR